MKNQIRQARRSRSNAFTLIELLVVIAIIAILAAILFPVFAQAKNAAKKTQVLSNMKNLQTGQQIYIGDNDGAYPELVQGGFEGRAGVVNRLWTRAIYPYIKNKEVYRDPFAGNSVAGFRFDASVAQADLGLLRNPAPCNNDATDRRMQSIGMNRSFFTYFLCNPSAQLGCKTPDWAPDPAQGYTAGQFITNESQMPETSKFVILATTTITCDSGAGGYYVNPQSPMNTIVSMTSRNGQGVTIAFADSSAKWFPAIQDADLDRAVGRPGTFRSPIQNRSAVLRSARGSGSSAAGVLDCQNYNSSGLIWSIWTAMPGENAQLDARCREQGI